MEYHSTFGVSCQEEGWVPSPSYIMRRDRALKLIDGLEVGRVLEIGCGAGGIIYDLAQKGFTCVAVETSDKARRLAEYINHDNNNVQVYPEIDPKWHQEFDYVFSFEVLEHIEEDEAALQQWTSLLKPGGKMIISVPADPNRWNASDIWAGHYRRYERKELSRKLIKSGLKVEYIENYGYPLANIIEPIRAFFHARQQKNEKQQSTEKQQQAKNTSRSGIQRNLESKLYPVIASKPGTIVMKGFCSLQGAFSSKDWGAGIMTLSCKK